MQEPVSAIYTSERIFEDNTASELCGSPRLKKATAGLKITIHQSSLAESHEGPFLNLVEDDTHCPDPRSLSSSDPSNTKNQPPSNDTPQSTGQHEHIYFLHSSVADIVEYVENIQIPASGNILQAYDDLADFYDQQLELSARRDFLRAAILKLELKLHMEDLSNGGSGGVGTGRPLAIRRVFPRP